MTAPEGIISKETIMKTLALAAGAAAVLAGSIAAGAETIGL